LEQSITIGLLF